ncbi:hypothetical protein OG223_17060 [Streptomyces sp. NBC_01478]|uniref:hypothetical protein n=1 Tax=Streptomyces sp. NBC_01478 TaxID=2903882 RepID=UPI002E349452|nr:hypothetical protein [Streptomyces sp. NBC_01478]
MGKGGRLALVIGSQCESLGLGKHLESLETAAGELDEAVRRPAIGGCSHALPELDGPLLNPSRDKLNGALVDAFDRADRERAVLVLAYIGHGLRTDDEYYVLPRDAEEDLGARIHPYPLVTAIGRFLSARTRLQGLILLLDTCDAGQGAVTAAKRWLVLNERDMDRRFHLLTSSSLEPSYECAFSRETARILRHGTVRCDPLLYCRDIRASVVERDVLEHQPVVLDYNGSSGASELWLARNQAPRPLARELRNFQATPDVDRVVAATTTQTVTMVQASAGSGKTTLLTALTRPELSKDIPGGFIHALHELRPADDVNSVARSLARQLRTSVPGFADVYVDGPDGGNKQSLLNALDQLHERVPIEQLSFRIALDGLDQLRQSVLPEIRDLVTELIYRQGYQQTRSILGMRVLLSGRPAAAPTWWEFTTVELSAAHENQITAYLTRRGIGDYVHRHVIERSGGNWLVVTLLADWLEDYDLDTLPDDTDGTYTQRLHKILGDESWEDSVVRAVLTVLTSAASATGAVAVPEPLLLQAVARLRRSATPKLVKGTLQRLSRLVITRPLDDEKQSYALFHPTLSQYLASGKARPGAEFGVDVAAGHRALGQALRELAPRGRQIDGDPLYDYAAEAEATHFWEQDDPNGVVQSLVDRVSAVPETNLLRWSSWLVRFKKTLGPYDLAVLNAQGGVAHWTEMCGHHATARKLYEELAADCQDALDPRRPNASHHPDAEEILQVGALAADWLGVDDPAMACLLYLKLEKECGRVLGPEHLVTLTTRNNAASWMRQAGDPARALFRFRTLVADIERIPGLSGSHLQLTARNGVATCLNATGKVTEALASWGTLLVEIERHQGEDAALAGNVRESMFQVLRPLVTAN